jgi:HTH-type transcriptional repressor of NAD biosynthesis genes
MAPGMASGPADERNASDRDVTITSICLIGPESTGKTTLARSLAEQYGTIFVPEFGRLYCEMFGNTCDVDDLRAIVRGHNLLATSARRRIGDGLLILDTDAVMTSVWADILLGYRPADLDHVDDFADLYLLTNVDIPFEDDGIRYFPDQGERERFFQRCRDELDHQGLRYLVLSGTREARAARAVAAIDDILANGRQNRSDKP